MRVLFAGYGSIARRHIANLRRICDARGEPLEVDLLHHAPAPVPEGVAHATCRLDELRGPYDAAFVTNPTSEHYATLRSLLSLSDNFFVEKPAFSTSDADLGAFGASGKTFYVACPLRYTRVLQWVRDNVDPSQVNGMRCISSSYLPDWRPGTDYRDTYSAHADMGGGAHIDLVHEWDYLCWLLGFPKRVLSVIGRYSQLEVSSPDTALYVADFGRAVAEVHLDYHGRAPVRELDIFTEDDTVRCDLIAGTVRLMRGGRVIDLSEDRDDYQARELEHFLAIVGGEAASDNDLGFATRVLRIAEGRWDG